MKKGFAIKVSIIFIIKFKTSYNFIKISISKDTIKDAIILVIVD